MGMHFKLGLYEHQSAGALEGLITALVNNPELVTGDFTTQQSLTWLIFGCLVMVDAYND